MRKTKTMPTPRKLDTTLPLNGSTSKNGINVLAHRNVRDGDLLNRADTQQRWAVLVLILGAPESYLTSALRRRPGALVEYDPGAPDRRELGLISRLAHNVLAS